MILLLSNCSHSAHSTRLNHLISLPLIPHLAAVTAGFSKAHLAARVKFFALFTPAVDSEKRQLNSSPLNRSSGLNAERGGHQTRLHVVEWRNHRGQWLLRKTRISNFRFVGYSGVELDVDVDVDMSVGGSEWLWRPGEWVTHREEVVGVFSA